MSTNLPQQPTRTNSLDDALLQELEVTFGEAKGLQVLHHLLEPGGEQESACSGHAAYEQLEHSGIAHAQLEVRVRHRELVQIGQERAARRIHSTLPLFAHARDLG